MLIQYGLIRQVFLGLLVSAYLFSAQKVLAEQAEAKPQALNPTSFYLVSGQPVAPWTLTLGDEDDWYMPLKTQTGTSAKKKVSVAPTNYKTENDALQITWRGKSGPGSVSLTGQTIDLSSATSNIALVLDLRVDSKIRGGIALAMDCSWPCRGTIALKPFLDAYPKKEWFTLPLPLSCFSKTGADLSKIAGPLHLQSEGRGKLSIANARLVALPEGSPDICANLK